MFEPHRHRPWQSPWPDDDAPLVLASFSTGQAWDQTSRIRRTLDAFADGRYRLLVTTGMADLSGTPVPPFAALASHVPHDTVLPRVSVTVTHAGHGTVAASLAHGVPLVCLPNRAADQPALAAQLAQLGAGIALDGDHATAADIARAVDTVLRDPGYAVSAGRLATVIDALPGAAGAATRLEKLAQ
ncbi:MAG: glycosyltransferase [Micromonosporaceae bacterium]